MCCLKVYKVDFEQLYWTCPYELTVLTLTHTHYVHLNTLCYRVS